MPHRTATATVDLLDDALLCFLTLLLPMWSSCDGKSRCVVLFFFDIVEDALLDLLILFVLALLSVFYLQPTGTALTVESKALPCYGWILDPKSASAF